MIWWLWITWKLLSWDQAFSYENTFTQPNENLTYSLPLKRGVTKTIKSQRQSVKKTTSPLLYILCIFSVCLVKNYFFEATCLWTKTLSNPSPLFSVWTGPVNIVGSRVTFCPALIMSPPPKKLASPSLRRPSHLLARRSSHCVHRYYKQCPTKLWWDWYERRWWWCWKDVKSNQQQRPV